MRKFAGFLAVTLILSVPAFCQRGDDQKGGGDQPHTQPQEAQPQHTQPQPHAPKANPEHGVGNGHIPAHGPAPTRMARPAAPAQHAAAPAPQEKQRRTVPDQPGHPTAPHVHAEMTNGSDTTPDPTIRTTISIILGSTAISPAASVRSTFTHCMAEPATASTSADSSSRSHLMITMIAATGIGVTMTSSFMRTRTTSAGTSRITRASARMSMCSI